MRSGSTAPILYEVNTRVWLRELSATAGRPLSLSEIPDSEIERWQRLGFTHIWLMGVWQVGPRARSHALEQWQIHWRDEILSTEEEVHGSPFAIQEYALDSRLGEPLSLLLLKERLGRAGLKLILDFVPNHYGLDCPDLVRHPGRFVQSDRLIPGTFEWPTRGGTRYYAHGRDPYFPPWTDTAQLDYRVSETQEAMAAIAQTISMYGDGLRCDMSMLILPEVFARTWSEWPCRDAFPAVANFWSRAIPAMRQLQSHTELIAEAYWGLEEALQGIGFDYAYNKRVYDHLVHPDPQKLRDLRDFLSACRPEFLRRGVHFLENHDEPRAAALFPLARHRAAAALILFLPGMALLHDGQLEGRTQFARIQLACRAAEQPDLALQQFYEDLLLAIQSTHVRRGSHRIVRLEEVDESVPPLVIQWTLPNGETDCGLVNLAGEPASGRLEGGFQGISAGQFRQLYGTPPGHDAKISATPGAIVFTLPPHSAQILRLHRPLEHFNK